jgi:2-hydroxy-6-oxonona-2,4-dienedioate hydrolase
VKGKNSEPSVPLRVPAAVSSLWSEVGGLRVHARIAGWNKDAEAVILVHGMGVSSRYMIPTLRALGSHVRVAAPDLPGFGRSDKPSSVLNIPELADALVAWMDSANVRSATLVANSMGCQIAVDMAVRHQARVERAVLVGPTLDPAIRTPGPALWRLALDTFREAPSQPFIVAYDYFVFGPRRLWQTFKHAAADPFESKLPAVHVPTLLVRGERDPIAPQHWVDTILRSLPQAELLVIPGAAHSVNYMAPEALASAVLGFMRRDGRPA